MTVYCGVKVHVVLIMTYVHVLGTPQTRAGDELFLCSGPSKNATEIATQ